MVVCGLHLLNEVVNAYMHDRVTKATGAHNSPQPPRKIKPAAHATLPQDAAHPELLTVDKVYDADHGSMGGCLSAWDKLDTPMLEGTNSGSRTRVQAGQPSDLNI